MTDTQTAKQKVRNVEVLNTSTQAFEVVSVPPKGMVVQTIYSPDPNSSLLPSEAEFGGLIKRQKDGNDAAAIIVCAPVFDTASEGYKYYATTQSRVEEAGFPSRPDVHRECQAIRETAYQARQHAKSRDGFGI